MASTDLQVQQIADAVGFKRATAFKLRFGMSPTAYRKRQG